MFGWLLEMIAAAKKFGGLDMGKIPLVPLNGGSCRSASGIEIVHTSWKSEMEREREKKSAVWIWIWIWILMGDHIFVDGVHNHYRRCNPLNDPRWAVSVFWKKGLLDRAVLSRNSLKCPPEQ